LADRCQRRVLFGAGRQCSRPACAPSAGLAQCAGSPAARGCDGCGVTGPGAASLPPAAPPGLLVACDCPLFPGPLTDQVGPVLRTGTGSRVAGPGCRPHAAGQWPANPASGPLTRPVAAAPRIGSPSRAAGTTGRTVIMDGGSSPACVTDQSRSVPRHDRASLARATSWR
jgi:hypothetical protein